MFALLAVATSLDAREPEGSVARTTEARKTIARNPAPAPPGLDAVGQDRRPRAASAATSTSSTRSRSPSRFRSRAAALPGPAGARYGGPRQRLQVLPTTLGGGSSAGPGTRGLLDTLTGELQRRLAATGRLTVIGAGGDPSNEVLEGPQFLVHAVVESWPSPAVHRAETPSPHPRPFPPVLSFRILSGVERQVLYTTRIALGTLSERIGPKPAGLIDAGLTEGVKRLTDWLSRAPWRGRVAAIEAGRVLLRSGAREGLEAGLELMALSDREPILDPETGLDLGRAWVPIGRLRLEEVGPDRSSARVLEGCESLKPGDLLEPARP